MTPAVQTVLLNAPFNPYRLAGNAAVYSLEGGASDSTYRIDGSNRVMLVADRSGNSAVNCLPLDGVSGNNASTPDAAANRATTEVELVVRLSAYDWTNAALRDFFGKYDSAGNLRSYIFSRSATSGRLALFISSAGTASESATSDAAVGFSNNQTGWVRVTWRASDQRVQFFTAADSGSNTEPSSWTQLGTTQTMSGAVASLFNSSTALRVGGKQDQNTNFPATYFYASIRKTIGGAIDQYFDPSATAKLGSSVVNGGTTWTINSTGATGARISGARDLYQGVQANQPIFSVSGGYNIATFDGSNDYLRSAPFTLAQPATRYSVLSQVGWTSTDQLWGGGAANTMGLIQSGVSPALVINAGSSVASNTGLVVGTRGVVSAIFNGASSSLQINLGAATTGNAGAGTPNGITIGAASDGSVPANMTWSEEIVRSVADSATVQNQINRYEMRKWSVTP